MKVVILADCISTQNAGIHSFALQWVQRVMGKYTHHEYIIISSERIDDLDGESIIVPIRKNIPFHMRWRQMMTIPNIANKLNPDWVIELAHFGPFGLNKGINRATMIHDLTPITHPQFHDFPSRIWHLMFLRGVIGRADYVITNSHWTKAEVINYANVEQDRIVVNYPKIKIPNQDLVKNKGACFKILTIGTIEPRKDQITIIKAIEDLVNNSEIEVELIILGKDGWKNGDFWKYLNDLPSNVRHKIHMKGYVNKTELEEELNTSDLFVFSSLAEGFGLPILEAMSFGLPILLSDIAIHREVATSSAIYFKTGDYQQLAKRISEIASSSELISSMKEQSRIRYAEMNSIEFEVPFLENEN